jgi:ribosomal protein S12 methylthiotransferase
MHPSVLAVTGPHATQEVMDAVHLHVPKPHDPFVDLVPPAGIKLTPKHYAYLKISEGCNHRCTFCIIPSMRGDLVSRPIGDVLGEAQRLFESGVKELLVISQDTSAYGVDVKYRTGFWDGKPVKTRMLDLCEKLGDLAALHGAWVRLHYVYPYPHVDELLPLMAEGKMLPYLDVPLQHAHPDVLKRMKRPASGERNMERLLRWREVCPQIVVRSTFIAGFPGETESEFEYLLDFMREAQIDRAGCFAYSPVEGATANAARRRSARRIARRAPRPFHGGGRRGFHRQAAPTHRRHHAGAGGLRPRLGPQGRGGALYADAPEIDGVVRLMPPEKGQQDLEGGRVHQGPHLEPRVGHDLIAQPI